jgi:hypothetical protein
MTTWSIKEAKARFAEFLDACLRQGPQILIMGNTEMVVVATARPLHPRRTPLPTLKPRMEIRLPARGRNRRRIPKPLV